MKINIILKFFKKLSFNSLQSQLNKNFVELRENFILKRYFMEKPAVDKKAIKQFFDFCKENEVEFIDFRVTDIKGIWHHFSFSASSIDESSFEGIPFDGSSFPAWQPVHQSDMILIPDPVRYFIDPFTADTTIVVFCDVWDIYKNKPYEK